MLLRNLFKKYKDDSQFVSLFSCWLEHQQGPCRNEKPEQQDSTELVHPKSLDVPLLCPFQKNYRGSEARYKGVNVPQQCFPSASQLHSERTRPALQGTVPSLGIENQNLFLYHLFVSVCVWRALFFSMFGSSCYRRTHVNLVLSAAEGAFSSGTREELFPVLIQNLGRYCQIYFCRDPKSPILNALILYHKRKV